MAKKDAKKDNDLKNNNHESIDDSKGENSQGKIEDFDRSSFIFNISSQDVEKELKSIQADFEMKGFRKGHVPMEVVMAKTDMNQVIWRLSFFSSFFHLNKYLEQNNKQDFFSSHDLGKITQNKNNGWDIEVIVLCRKEAIKNEENIVKSDVESTKNPKEEIEPSEDNKVKSKTKSKKTSKE